MIAVRIALGIVVPIFVGRALAGQLFEVRAADPLALGAAALVFGVVAIMICLLPAMRAAKTDLLAALHRISFALRAFRGAEGSAFEGR